MGDSQSEKFSKMTGYCLGPNGRADWQSARSFSKWGLAPALSIKSFVFFNAWAGACPHFEKEPQSALSVRRIANPPYISYCQRIYSVCTPAASSLPRLL